jgi:citrate synthase
LFQAGALSNSQYYECQCPSLQPKLIATTTFPLRPYSSASEPDLKTTLKEAIPAKRELLKKVKSHANKKIGEVHVENTLGGMR